MGCASLIASSTLGFLHPRNLIHRNPRSVLPICSCSYSNPDFSLTTGNVDSLISQAENGFRNVSTEDQLEGRTSMTGGAFDFKGATTSLTNELMSSSKKVTLVRHGLSSWNEESRVQVVIIFFYPGTCDETRQLFDYSSRRRLVGDQCAPSSLCLKKGSSNLSILTDTGARQAEKCRNALINLNFDLCFSSPISRAKSTAELIWHEKEQPLVFLDSLKEAHLFFLEGMTNADAKKTYPELYNTWREDPVNFSVDGIYPIRKLWGTAREAWKEILSTPGKSFLVVTHKSILRALICTALGLGPERFRAIDVNNGGISTFTFNRRGEAMLQCLNMTAHMYSDHIYQY